jgi:hypothetical protein
MVAIKSLITLLPVFLTVTTALPGKVQVDGTNLGARGTVDVASTSHGSDSDSNSNTHVGVNFYQDKNPDSHTKIDPNTCKGNAEIALMKWRSNCKAFNAIFRGSCYTHAPSEERCCPLAKGKSCWKYWPKEGE